MSGAKIHADGLGLRIKNYIRRNVAMQRAIQIQDEAIRQLADEGEHDLAGMAVNCREEWQNKQKLAALKWLVATSPHLRNKSCELLHESPGGSPSRLIGYDINSR